MNILLYANNPEKARLLVPWAHCLSERFLTKVTVQATRKATQGEAAAAKIFREEIGSAESLEFQTIKTDKAWPEEGIAREAARGDYNLVVLAPAGRRGFIRLFYGSMVGKVVRRVSTSVLIVRGGDVPPKRILACVSGSRHSLTNVRAAAQLAVAFGGSVTIMMVLSQLPIRFSGKGPLEWQEGFLASDEPLAVHLRAAQDLLHNLGARGSVCICSGLVVEKILSEMDAHEHDLLIVGTHRVEEYDPLYEDVTAELVQKADRTTLVVGLRADLL